MNIERVVEAIRTINRLADLGDAVYDVREREGEGWEGPKVTEYSNAVTVLQEEGVLTPAGRGPSDG